MKITVSVPGKVHLMGEHAVVYGKPAILAAVNVRMYVTIQDQRSKIKYQIISTESIEYATYAVDYLLQHLKIVGPPPFRITITSQIPAGYHLGSSAAMAVGITAAMLYFFKKLWNPMRVNELAYEIEKHQHGTPSGGDNTAVTFGGFIWYRRELEFLKSMWQLPFRISPQIQRFVLIDTGKPAETTGEMIAFVKEKGEKDTEQMEKIFAVNEAQVRAITVALKEGDEATLIASMRRGEKTLEDMGVVSVRVRPFIRAVEASGGAAKILGGGGRQEGVGFLLVYHPSDRQIRALAKKYIYPLTPIQLGEEGVRLESK